MTGKFRNHIDIANLISLVKNSDLITIKSHFRLNKDDMVLEDQDGRTAFFWACTEGKLEIAEYFYELGSNINHQDKNDWTSLHFAAFKNNIPIVYFLLSNHANVNLKNSYQFTPLHYAASKGNIKVVEMLLDFNINSHYFHMVPLQTEIMVNLQDQDGATPLIRAIVNAHTEVVRLLIQYQADLNLADTSQNTPMHYACHDEENKDIAVYLLLNGAEIFRKNKKGDSPIDIAKPKIKSTLLSIYQEGMME